MNKRLITAEDLLKLKFIGGPQISPDGERAAFTVKAVETQKNHYVTHLWMADIGTGRVRQFTHGEVTDGAPQWSPDGGCIAFVRTKDKQSQIWIIPADGGEAWQLTKLDEGGIGAPQWSPDGRRIALTFRPTHPDWTEKAGKEREEKGLSNPPRIITRLFYRMDGEGFLDTRQHLWTCDAETGEAKQLTSGEYDSGNPAWSPDGKRLAFTSNRSADPEMRPYEIDIWLMPSEGGELRRVPTPIGSKRSLVWSPDGKRIAYVGYAVGEDPWGIHNDRLWVVGVENGDARCLTESLDRAVGNVTLGDARVMFGGSPPAWSKDGERLFFQVSDKGSAHLYTVSPSDARPIALTKGAIDVLGFSVDAKAAAFILLIDQPSQPPEVFSGSLDAEGFALRPLTMLNAPILDGLTLSEPEEVWFSSSDGTEIQGWVMKPPDFEAGRKYPFLLSIHGGPHAQYGNVFFHEFQMLAARGYVVMYANPRGSFGREEEFAACIRGDWGNLDYDDVMAAADFAETLPYVDTERMAVMGGSYGGYMTNWIVGHTGRFRCAITDRSVSNLHADFGTVDWPEHVDGYWPGDAWDRPESMWEMSPLKYAASISTPLLILHSEGDLRCPIHHAEQLYVALKLLKREVAFIRYPQETNHSMSRTGPPDLRLDRLGRMTEWLDKHLKG
ncbi:MAG: S9 family peptidase [Chloroflexi bacterium]|nr:S9 family peptidase [Chloroflexota bacterium]